MDYEQKCKEYLERAKEQLNGAKVFDYDNEQIAHDIRTTVYSIFPELKEPEDEEVRKAMIDFFKHEREEGIAVLHYGVNIERMISWLEKQGQVKESLISQHENKTCKENDDSLTGEDDRIRKDLIGFFKDGGFLYHKKEEIVEWLEKQGEQKPAWSEEDDNMLNRLILHFDWTGNYRFTKSDCDAAQNWLKSLKDRVHPQPKQEWSEEDEKKLLCICAWIKDYPRIADFKDEMNTVANNYIDWLKSLKYQNTWKPSETDILLLERMANGKSNPQDFQASLGGLIGQLKKLREK